MSGHSCRAIFPVCRVISVRDLAVGFRDLAGGHSSKAALRPAPEDSRRESSGALAPLTQGRLSTSQNDLQANRSPALGMTVINGVLSARLKSLRENVSRPFGTGCFLPLYPALKALGYYRNAPSGADSCLYSTTMAENEFSRTL